MFLHYWSVFFLSIISIHWSAYCIRFTRSAGESLLFAFKRFWRTKQEKLHRIFVLIHKLSFTYKKKLYCLGLPFCYSCTVFLEGGQSLISASIPIFIRASWCSLHFVLFFLKCALKTIFCCLHICFCIQKQHIVCNIALPWQLCRRTEGMCGFPFLGVDLGHILGTGLFHRDALIRRNQLARSKVQDICLRKLNRAPCHFFTCHYFSHKGWEFHP